ncbi:hypothetical protein CTEN210_04607 [Chaetoceros tenuissimus]|uniref:Limiting CO2-inducible protein B/C beta carbonyic anhydrase domain-containing protein n=1 Tax=Chaetoceros tenuissimus TaxID=426638 RepID=A0AAD3CLH2_9STRA|nr:hypothetical protein CTEN210_04607 [Chaetoceros tenuissimus]
MFSSCMGCNSTKAALAPIASKPPVQEDVLEKKGGEKTLPREKARTVAFAPASEKSIPSDLEFDNVAAFEAAYRELRSNIDDNGSIDLAEITKVMQQKKSVLDLVQKHFPGAGTGKEILAKVAPVIEKYGLDDDNTLFAQSVCPDEINHDENDTPALFAEYLGEVFHMGGLAGIPFTGKTGFAAFSHHVPENGHLFILMAPHIGLSESNQLGKYTRDGQDHDGSACGAVVGALNHCCSGKPLPKMADSAEDAQMTYIMHQIKKHQAKIVAKKNESENAMQAMAAKVTHDIGRDMLNAINTMDFGGKDSQLLLLTGIQINMPKPFDGFFQPISFQIRNKNGQMRDLFRETFGVTRDYQPTKSTRFLKVDNTEV